MSWKSVLSLFNRDDLYTQALEESHQMLDIGLKMFDASVESLRRFDDGTIPVDVYAMDKQVNRFERDVRRKVMTHLTVSGPADLSSGLILVSVVIDIERIGDYAKNIYDLARWHPRRLEAGSLESEVADIEQRVGELFRVMVDAFKTSDVDKARKIMVDYKEKLSADCERLVMRIVGGEVTDLSPGDTAALVLYIRYLKRISAHSRNLVSGIVNPFHRIGYREKSPKSPDEA
jgi:phosphate transport system protein